MSTRRPHIPRILLAFDFDLTLGSHSVTEICAHYGVSVDEWKRDFVEPLGDGWNEVMLHGEALMALGRAKGQPLTDAVMAQVARERIALFPGVLEMPGRLRAVAEGIAPGVMLEFVVLSSGYDEIITATPIVEAFDHVLSSGFHDDVDGEPFTCVKRAISHPDKALYLEALGKGMSLDLATGPDRAGDPVAPDDMHCPFDQMIYLGDGESDLQAFGFLHSLGGLAIAVEGGGGFEPERITDVQRVDGVLPPDYSPGAPLMTALEHAVRACAHRVALRGMGRS